ncbi:MAG: cytochrome c [Caulobacteraceae bacterium]|nr:cytochrome c [Caulobacteraceae bacterium]
MSRFAWGLVCGAAGVLGVIGLAALAVVQFGLFDVRASTPHGPLATWAMHATMIHVAQRGGASVGPAPPIGPDDIQTGAALYDQNCAACHGGPGLARARWANGMTPSPPFLLDAARRWTRPQLFWIVRNGVKMTGMPAWSSTLSDGQVWDLAAFLEALPDLSPRAYARVKAAAVTPPPRPETRIR